MRHKGNSYYQGNQFKQMEKLSSLKTAELVDILSTQTRLYMQMQAGDAGEIEFEQCRLLIKLVQEEIKSRKETKQS
jgi:hypothetical protein